MNLSEFELIHRIRDQRPTAPDRVLLGIGDDTAVVRPTPGMALLVTTEMARWRREKRRP